MKKNRDKKWRNRRRNRAKQFAAPASKLASKAASKAPSKAGVKAPSNKASWKGSSSKALQKASASKTGIEDSRSAAVVREYKDTIFRMLYSDKKELLVLYNAVNNANYADSEQLEVVTLEHAIYMYMKNDVSFILDTGLSLYEQQSSVCPNMPLRDLMYVAKQFEELTVGRDIYSSRLIQLPAPRFVTFYNGKRPQPERLEQRLSDAYYKREDAKGHTREAAKGDIRNARKDMKEDDGEDIKEDTREIIRENLASGTLDAGPNLELRVLQLNINPGYNEELKKKCPTLLQYVQYVECVRKYEKDMPLRDAVEAAVEECIREGILRDFLLREKAKVISMSIFEFDQELHDRTIRNESWEDGWIEGKAEGRAEGKAEGKLEGEWLKLVTLVCRKLRKGKNVEEISDELEEDIAEICLICKAAEEFAPKYDERQVLGKVMDIKEKNKTGDQICRAHG